VGKKPEGFHNQHRTQAVTQWAIWGKMRFSHDQHKEMSKRLHERSKAERNPEAAKKQAAMANVFRQLAEKAAKQGAKSADVGGRQ
jgi:hypothetical protein